MSDVTPVPLDLAKLKDQPASPAYCSNLPNGEPHRLNDPQQRFAGTRAAADTANLWPNGTSLKVHFLNDGDAWGQTVRAAIERLAPTWSEYANLSFDFSPQPTAHIAVQLSPVQGYAYWSVYGKQSRDQIARGTWSMSLAFNPTWARASDDDREKEFARAILHEFGHAIGYFHEHMRPDRAIVWNEPLLDDYCLTNFGWQPDMVTSQILEPYRPNGPMTQLKETAFDINSIMMYEYPIWKGQPLAVYENTNKPFVTPNNFALTPLDKVLANMLYPATGVTDPNEDALVPGDPPTTATIEQAGQVVRYRFKPGAAGPLQIAVTGSPVLVSMLNARKDPGGRMVAFDTSVTPSLKFNPLRPNDFYFLEVRHAQTMTGTGSFTISLAPTTA